MVEDKQSASDYFESPLNSLSSSQARLKPNQSSLTPSSGPDITPAKVSSPLTPYEVEFNENNKDTWKFQFYLAGDVCSKDDFLYAFNSSFYYRPKTFYTDCEDGQDRPATFMWEKDSLYLYHKTYRQLVFADRELRY